MDLGVQMQALKHIEAAWSEENEAWAFPMRNGADEIVGVRLRSPEKKWAIKGSINGLFVPRCTPQETAVICEGPTDTAAALSMGYYAIGRASCMCGNADLKRLLRLKGVRQVVIIADRDTPGQRGAEKLAVDLAMKHKLVIPQTKDIRQFCVNGGNRATMDAIINYSVWKLCRQ
jgi:DNA primase